MSVSLRHATVPQRLGAALAVLGLWGLLGWLVWWLVWPGPPVALTLDAPHRTAVVPTDTPLMLRGRVLRARRLTCNGRRITPDAQGRFQAAIPGPTRAGMYVVRCEGTNSRGRRYPFAHARIAGRQVPLGAPIQDAVVAVLPLPAVAAGRFGWLQPLADLVTRLGPAFVTAGGRTQFSLHGFSVGPLRLRGITLLGIQAAGKNRLQLTLGLQHLSLGLAIPTGWVPKGVPDALRTWLPALSGTHRVPLGSVVPLRVTLHWPPGGRPEISLGLLGTQHLRQALRYRYIMDAAVGLAGALSKELQRELMRLLSGAGQMATSTERLFAQLQRGVQRFALLLPALPAAVSPLRPAVCLGLELSHMSTDPKWQQVRVHLRARIRGYTVGGRRCDAAGALRRIPAGGRPRVRLALGPPTPTPTHQGPGVLISHDLVNAYLAALWAAGTLERVPVRLPELREHGFDIRRLRYGLPPVLTTAPDGLLRFEVPELGVELDTRGEPRRLFSAHLRLRLRPDVSRRGVLGLTVDRRRRPAVFVRCEREAGRACAAQSRRFQDLVDIGTEIAFQPEMAMPPLQLQMVLPVLDAKLLKVSITGVHAMPRGVRVSLKIR